MNPQTDAQERELEMLEDAQEPLCIACGTAEPTVEAKDKSPYCQDCWGLMVARGAACPSCREDHPSRIIKRDNGQLWCKTCGWRSLLKADGQG